MKCTICNAEITGRYLIDAWHQVMCVSHKVEYCSSCGRFVTPSDLHLSDGRCICSSCHPSIVCTAKHVGWVELRVRSILSRDGINDLPINIPIQLVSPSEMAQFNGTKQINLNQHGLTHTSQMIGLLSSRFAHHIYILDNLPKVQFAGVLAHEMLHVWQSEKDISLPAIYAEGFCNVGSYVVYQAINTDLSQHFISQLERNPDPVYGDGFRKAVSFYKRASNLVSTMTLIKGAAV